jgi:putative transposase
VAVQPGWFGGSGLAWHLSIGRKAEFCVEALAEAIGHYDTADNFNTYQGAQFSGADFARILLEHGIRRRHGG